MIITTNRILFPSVIDDDDPIIRESKMKTAAKNIRKRKITFDLRDVERFSEHDDNRFIEVWFHFNEPVVIEYDYAVMEAAFRDIYEKEQEDDTLTYWIPKN